MRTSPATVAAPPTIPRFHRDHRIHRGFTLVELMAATVVLAVGLVALTSAGAASVKLERRGQQLSTIAVRGETRLELLRAGRCSSASGSSDDRGSRELWSAAHGPAGVKVIVDSVILRADGAVHGSRAHVFRSSVSC